MSKSNVIPFPGAYCCDLPAREDALRLDSYTAALADYIASCPLPMTISLQGSWGSGKSSMMNLVEQALAEKALCVSFNTWQYSQFDLGEQLPILFYQSLMEKLGAAAQEDAPKSERIKDACRRGLSLAARLTARHFGLEAELDLTLGAVKGDGPKPARPASLTETVEGLRESFQELVKARLEQEKKDRAVFFIDDLDRLPPARAVALMEVLKTALECDECVFVLAIDYDVVIRGVKDKYGEDFGAEKGRSFFDKMIQLPFDLPVEQYQMDDFVRGLIRGIGDAACAGYLLGEAGDEADPDCGYPGDFEYVRDLALLTAGKNPRSLKRLFNSFALMYRVVGRFSRQFHSCSLSSRQEHVLLWGVLCLKSAYPRLYDHLLTVCHSASELGRFYLRPFEDAAWTGLTEDRATAASLGLSGLDAAAWARLRSYLRRFFSYSVFQDPRFEAEAAEDRDGFPFPVKGWTMLEKVMEVSATHDWPVRCRVLIPEESRFQALTSLIYAASREWEREAWKELTRERLVSCFQTAADALSQGAVLGPGVSCDDGCQRNIGLDGPLDLSESALWETFRLSGVSLKQFRENLEGALKKDEAALDRLTAQVEKAAGQYLRVPGPEDPSRERIPLDTAEGRARLIREYITPPSLDIDALLADCLAEYLGPQD